MANLGGERSSKFANAFRGTFKRLSRQPFIPCLSDGSQASTVELSNKSALAEGDQKIRAFDVLSKTPSPAHSFAFPEWKSKVHQKNSSHPT